MHNIGTVIRFEITRTLKKKSFWILALSFPLMFVVIFGIIMLSSKATNNASKDIEKQKFSFVVSDESGVVNPAIVASLSGKVVDSDTKAQQIDAVKNGQLDGYIYYPKNLTTDTVETYGKNVNIFTNNRYDGVAKTILSLSAADKADANTQTALKGDAKTKLTTYKDGQEYDAVKRMILPGVFLVLFYFLIAFFGNQMLTSTTEEKENRVIEMILTTIEARTLVIGKIISLVILAFIQGLLVIVPAVVGYLLFHDQLNLPMFDLTSLPVDWMRIGIGAAVFVASFLLFTGLLVTIGSSVPTAKEAGGFFGVVMMLIFGPLYAASLFVSSPDEPIVKVLSLFPFTAPIPLMLRNAIGNLGVGEALLGIAILLVTAVIVLFVAVRVFRFGALEYSRKLSLKEILARK